MPPFSLPWRSRLLFWLQLSLVAGALYDLFFAGLLVLAPELPQRLLELEPPAQPYLWLIALFLVMLAGFYLYAAYDPVSYEGNVLVAIGGRALGAAVMGFVAWREPALWGFGCLAAGDLFFAAAHAAFYLPIRPLITH